MSGEIMQIVTPGPEQIQPLLAQPGFIPWHINGTKAQLLCRHLSEAQIYNAAFLDQRLPPAQDERLYSIPLTAFEGQAGSAGAETAWIFHTSFCASTLLARLIQNPRSLLVMKEPMVLNQLAEAFRSQSNTNYQPLLQQITAQLIKPFHAGQQVVIKTSNYMNALLNQVHGLDSTGNILLVYGGITPFITSMLKNRNEAEKTLPVFLRALQQDVATSGNYQPGTDFWSDVAHTWAVQIRLFTEFVVNTQLPVKVISKHNIQQAAEQTLRACDQFLGHDSDRDTNHVPDIMGSDAKKQAHGPDRQSGGHFAGLQAEIDKTKALAWELIPEGAEDKLREYALLPDD